jgi:UDP-N-acetylmuramate dehydrogenase
VTQTLETLDRRLADAFGVRWQHQAPLGARTTYRVGGAAARLVTVDDDGELAAVAVAVADGQVPVLVIGKGSNLLVADAGFEGVAVLLGDAFAGIDVGTVDDGSAIVRAGGAASLPVVARRTAGASLTGFEWAVGVPGSIGGAVRMNAGGHGSDVATTLTRVRVVDLASGEDGVVPASLLDLAYRRSAVQPAQVVAWAELALRPGDRADAEEEIAEIVRWRRANQPGGQNAGSVFANPPGDSAGRLIDAAGCKGLRIGSAEVSPKHANFIQADPGGRADDVRAVMAEIRHRVFDHAGVVLHPENLLVGFAPLPEVDG